MCGKENARNNFYSFENWQDGCMECNTYNDITNWISVLRNKGNVHLWKGSKGWGRDTTANFYT